MPTTHVDMDAANRFVAAELGERQASRFLRLVRPEDDPESVEDCVRREPRCVGFKVYHVYASRAETFDATPGEFLSDWMLEIADRHNLWIMLHLVRSRALADPANQEFLREKARRYSGARIVLAHAARGFCAAHTVETAEQMRSLDNVFFDTSAICEPPALQAIMKSCGSRRLLYGSDFPVSALRGRVSSLGDGFFWLYRHNVDWQSANLGQPSLVGLESLLALKLACRLENLADAEIEAIFAGNARSLLGQKEPSSPQGQTVYESALKLIPGGTQLLSKRPEMYAPGRWPPYFSEARGVEITDLDGRRFIDMSTMSVGACLLGYADPDVDAAVCRRVRNGSMASLNSGQEVELAEVLLDIHTWGDGVRFARGGGEALAVAVRIARATTHRDVVAFCGYHGWTDWYLAANLGAAENALGEHLLPGLDPAGVPRGLAGTVLPFRYNDISGLEAVVEKAGSDLAAIVLEPTRNESPAAGFLERVRQLATEKGAVLVFDEVSSGWRFHLGGVHLRFGVEPDMAAFAKATGNGYPVAAVIGRDWALEGAQGSFISSTFWTDGIGPAAALATIEKMRRIDVPGHVEAIGRRYLEGLAERARSVSLPLVASGHPPLTYLSFEHPDAAALQTLWTARMLERGFLVGSGFYPSLAHEPIHVDRCLDASAEVFQELSQAAVAGDAEERLGSPVKHTGFRRLA